MCFKTKAPKVPEPRPAPGADDTAAATADQRRRLTEQPSTYGSVFTSVLGDPNYGRNVQRNQPVATLGA